MTDDAEDIPMATLAYAPPDLNEARWPVRFAWIALAILWAGWGFVGTISAETVVVTGPALVIAAVLLIVFAVRAGQGTLVLVGIGHIGLCGLLFALVASLNLSPRRAVVPFLMIGAVWAAAATVLTFAHRKRGFLHIERHRDGLSIHIGSPPQR